MSGTFEFLKNYEGKIFINGKTATSEDIDKIEEMNFEEVEIELIPKCLSEQTKFRIYVKAWMSNDSGNLDFHQRWNNGVAMPERDMTGEILAETPGMRKMNLYTIDGKQHWTGYVSKSATIDLTEISEEEFNGMVRIRR
ncbi:MAG: hypothetical protein RR342_01525 [Bacilli bacterium]